MSLTQLVNDNRLLNPTVNADGSYNAWVRADTYRLETSVDAAMWQYTVPDVGADATDSDVYDLGTDTATNLQVAQPPTNDTRNLPHHARPLTRFSDRYRVRVPMQS